MRGLMATEAEIYHNAKEKQYPQGYRKISIASRKVYRESGWELSDKSDKSEKVSKPQNPENASRSDSIRRAKQKVFDIAAMNNFDYFITWTLDSEKINRYSAEELMKKLANTLRNWVSRYSLKYLLLPEYHKDGALHLHGLISGNMKMTDSGTFKAPGFNQPVKLETILSNNIPLEQCHTVYNMPQWSLGWSTAIPTYGDVENCAKYITKYVTKDMQKIFGNFYYAGGKIVRDVPYKLFDIDYEKVECERECYCDIIDTSFKFFETREVV